MSEKYEILIREMEDWENLSFSKFVEKVKSKNWAPHRKSQFLNNVHKFNKTFSINFIDYRKELFRIAKFNWSKLGIKWSVCDKDNVHKLSDKLVYLITDDDDWFSCDTINKIEAMKTADNIICWKTLKINCDNQGQVYSEYANDQKVHEVASNGYAIKKATKFPVAIIGDHRTVIQYKNKTVLPYFLSVKVNTPSCRYYLCNKSSLNSIVPDLDRYEIPIAFTEFKDEIAMLSELNKRLFKSCELFI